EYAQERLNPLYQDFVTTSLMVDRGLAIEGFEATEQDRADAMEQGLAFNRPREKLPPEYWSTLSKLRAARAADLSHADKQTKNRVQQLRQDLDKIENKLGLGDESTRSTKSLEKNSAENALRSIQ